MAPSAIGWDCGGAYHRMVQAGAHVLVVSHQHVTAAIGGAPSWRARSDPEVVVHINVTALCLRPALGNQRDRIDPPPPVLVDAPVPSRLNQVSIVNVAAPRPGVELPTRVPLTSFMPQRPMRPGADASSLFIEVWICACERAMFHTRASSRVPAKKPAVAPTEVMAVARPAC